VRFNLLTPDANGCFLNMPYKVDRITIYFVERSFVSGKTTQYNEKVYDKQKLALAEIAEAEACVNPTNENIEKAKRLRQVAESNVKEEEFYFNEAVPINIVGSSTNPSWLRGGYIGAISATNPAQISIVDYLGNPLNHNLNTNDVVYIYNSNCLPPIDGSYKVTVTSSTAFTIDVDLSTGTAGTSGMWFTAEENTNNILEPLVVNNKTVVGEFVYLWEPKNAREGDYFICWKWTPLAGGDSLSSHLKFSLSGDTQFTTSIPSHFTNPQKYSTLLERYTPEMFKMYISDSDVTPNILNNFNNAVALGFTALEDLTNQIVDLQSPNSLHESLIPYLSNFFNLKLKTSDPTRWRGQVVRAIPVFKSKGTLNSIAESLQHAGMKLLRLKQLWQVISKYTWQESFVFDGQNLDFELEKVLIEPLDPNNFSLWIRPVGSDDYTDITGTYYDYVTFNTQDGLTTMSWTSNILDLVEGDIVRVLYQYNNIPNTTEQNLEDYVRLLPILDQRDERSQGYPLKNWNVRGIEDDDVLFDLIVPMRHPYHDYLIYGKIRTEFPYSENIYNMEEYNGSIRNSKNPCDIDKDFIDPCSYCMSSSYNMDVEIENITNDRIAEFYEVLTESMPFHAVLHTANIIGGFQEFVASPVEDIECLVTVRVEQLLISGDAQRYFTRTMRLSNLNNLATSECIFRGQLATRSTVASGLSGTASNSEIVLYCPSVPLQGLGIRNDGSAKLEILSGNYAGEYIVDKALGNTVHLQTLPTEPIDNNNLIFNQNGTLSNNACPFRIFEPIIDNFNYGSLCDVNQENFISLTDSGVDFDALGVQTQFDVDNGTAASAWTVLIGSTQVTILDIAPNGSLILDYDSGLPSSSTSGVSYSIYDGMTLVASGTTGYLNVVNRGRVTVLNSSVLPISSMINTENNYMRIGMNDYLITSLVKNTDDQFYIDGWNGGDIIGTLNLIVSKRIVENQIGYLSYRGLQLELSGDLVTSYGIQNGLVNGNYLVPVNSRVMDNNYKENYIVEIDGERYWMDEIETDTATTVISLSGTENYWKTTGTSVTVNLYKFTIEGATIMGQQFDLPEHTFDTLDRSGRPVITNNIETITPLAEIPLKEDDGLNDFVKQKESISYKIDYTNGSKEEGEL